MADTFTRNEILTSNEVRQILGMKPSDDPKADQLVNSNISQAKSNQQENINQMQTMRTSDSKGYSAYGKQLVETMMGES